MYKLTLYKYVPHFLKWRFWMYTGDFDKYKSDTEYTWTTPSSGTASRTATASPIRTAGKTSGSTT